MEELIFSSVSTNVAVPIFRVSESGRYELELHRSGSVHSVGEESPDGQRSFSTHSVLHLSCPTHSEIYRRVPGFTLKIATIMFVEPLGNFHFFAPRYAEFRFLILIDKSKILSTVLTCG
jgi:hypothetical protein